MLPQDTTPTKICSKCGEEKPATTEYFCSNKSCRNGIEGTCKECRNARSREFAAANRERLTAYKHDWYMANHERLVERNRAYFAANRERENLRRRENYRANKERDLENIRKWVAANKEHVRQRHLKWRIANREHLREKSRSNSKKYFADPENKARRNNYLREWRVKNPFSPRAAKLRRRARVNNAEGFHTAEDIRRQYKAQKGKCYYCGEKVGDDYHVDHVIPLSRGGSNGPENLVIACPPCNSSKGDKLPSEWSQGGRLL